MTSYSYIHAEGSSEGDWRYVVVERYEDGGRRLVICLGAQELGIDLDAGQVAQLRDALGPA